MLRPSEFRRPFFNAKHLGTQTDTHTNKKLHNLFPMSVHSLLDKRNYQYASLVNSGFRSIHNLR